MARLHAYGLVIVIACSLLATALGARRPLSDHGFYRSATDVRANFTGDEARAAVNAAVAHPEQIGAWLQQVKLPNVDQLKSWLSAFPPMAAPQAQAAPPQQGPPGQQQPPPGQQGPTFAAQQPGQQGPSFAAQQPGPQGPDQPQPQPQPQAQAEQGPQQGPPQPQQPGPPQNQQPGTQGPPGTVADTQQP